MAVSDTNSVVLVGRLTRDPERRGSALSMRLAYNASRQGENGWEDVAQFVDAACFGATADAIERMAHKGTRVVVQGRLAWREWEQDDGTKRQAHSIACQSVQLVDPKPADGSTYERASPPPPAPVGDADIPF